MTYIAELQIVVDSSQIDNAKKSLDDLSKVSPNVSKKIKETSQSFDEAGAAADKLSSAQKRLVDRAKEQVATFGKTKEDVLSYIAGLLGVSGVVDPLVGQLKTLKDEQQQLTNIQKQSQAVNNAVVKSQEQLSTAQYRMIESLREEIALFGKSKDEILLYRANLMGVSDQVAPLVAELQRLKEAKEQEAKAGISDQGTKLSNREAEKKALREEAAALEKIIALDRERAALAGAGIGDRKRGDSVAALEATRLKLDMLESSESRLENATRQTSAALKAQAGDVGKLIGQIDPTVKALDKLDAQQSKLRSIYNSPANKGGRLIDREAFEQYNGMLNASRKRIEDLGKTSGKTAKEINFALRGLPAQFTDIFVSLQGGQQPLTVLLQQGGQIKDMFGGIGPAFKALGGYVLSLLNPLTLSIAALGTLAVAWYQGSEESRKFRQSLIVTGFQAGVTSEQLNAMAASLDGITTRRNASKVLTEIANSGKIAGENFEAVARVAILLEKTTGQAVEETVTSFAKLKEKPLETLKELNDRYNFLTVDIIKNVSALIDQGKQQEAAALAAEKYIEAMEELGKRIPENTGLIESAWKSLKDAASEAWDEMLGIGRDQSIDERLTSAAEGAAAKWTNKLKSLGLLGIGQGLVIDSFKAASGPSDQAIVDDNYNKQLEQIDAEKKKRQKLIADEALAASERNSKRLVENLTNEQKLEKEIQQIKKDGITLSLTENQINDQIAAAKERATKKEKAQRSTVVTESAAAKLLSKMKQQEASLDAQKESTSRLGKEASSLIKLRERVSIIEEKAGKEALTKDEKSLLSNRASLIAQQEKNVALERQIELDKELAKLASFKAALDAQIANDRQKYQDALIGATSSDKEATRMKERNILMREYQRQLEDLGKQQREGSLDGTYDEAASALKENLNERLRLQEEHYGKLDELQSDWKNGAIKSWENYRESVKDVAGMTANLFDNAFKGMEDAIVGFVTTGKLSFKDLAVSILSDLARMATRIAANKILSSVIGSFAGGAGGGSGGWGAVVGAIGSAVTQAKGGAWSGGTQFFANGGAFTNSIVSRPTAFGTGRGLGVMGEAGPEAIMPLTRTADGQLGVQATGGGGSSVVAPVNVVVNTSSGPGSSTEGGNNSQGRAVQQAVKSECEKAIAIGLQPGGQIWRAMNGR